jgi:hypothetical protein
MIFTYIGIRIRRRRSRLVFAMSTLDFTIVKQATDGAQNGGKTVDRPQNRLAFRIGP